MALRGGLARTAWETLRVISLNTCALTQQFRLYGGNVQTLEGLTGAQRNRRCRARALAAHGTAHHVSDCGM